MPLPSVRIDKGRRTRRAAVSPLRHKRQGAVSVDLSTDRLLSTAERKRLCANCGASAAGLDASRPATRSNPVSATRCRGCSNGLRKWRCVGGLRMTDNLLIEMICICGDRKVDVLFAPLKQEVSQ